jgi:hypothetical protein
MRKYAAIKPEVQQEQKNLCVRGITDDILFVTEQVSCLRLDQWSPCLPLYSSRSMRTSQARSALPNSKSLAEFKSCFGVFLDST